MEFKNNREAAIEYARRGWRVFPLWPPAKHSTADAEVCTCSNPNGCGNAGKHPITDWELGLVKGVHSASNNVEDVERWWRKYPDANIGIACGKESNLLVFDADSEHAFDYLTKMQGLDTPVIVQTMRGYHLYFRYAPGIGNRIKVGNMDFDIRTDGGYVVAPPSMHPSGQRYRWYGGYPDLPLQPAKIATETVQAIIGEASRKKQTRRTGLLYKNPPAEIPKGEREVTLFKLACSMRADNVPEEFIEEKLRTFNKELCVPPLDEAEVQKALRSALAYPPGSAIAREIAQEIEPLIADEDEAKALADALLTGDRTDRDDALRVYHLYGEDLHYAEESDIWLKWDGVRWKELPDVVVRALVAEAGQKIRWLAATRLQGDSAQTFYMEMGTKMRNTHRQNAIIEQLKSVGTILTRMSDFDQDDMIIATPTQHVNLRDATIMEPDRSRKITRTTAVEYDPNAYCPIWEDFLDDVLVDEEGNPDPELRLFMQMALGYSLTGSNTEQKFFICKGKGANGKSVLLNTVRAVMGDYGASTGFDTFDYDKEGPKNNLARLRGTRFVTAFETNDEKNLNQELMKNVTGGDPVVCRFLYKEEFEYVPQFKVWLSVNLLPRITGTDDGIWRRVIVVPFYAKFVDNEKELEHYPHAKLADKNLKYALMREHTQKAILNWLVEGARLWAAEQRLPIPDIIERERGLYRSEQDIVQQFIDEQCVVYDVEPYELSYGAPDLDERGVPLNELFDAFEFWRHRMGYSSWSRQTFKTRLEDQRAVVGIRRNRKRIQMVYGIGLKYQNERAVLAD